MKLNSEQIKREVADILNDKKWGSKDFICMKKSGQDFGFMLRDERDTIYSGPYSIIDERTSFTREENGNQCDADHHLHVSKGLCSLRDHKSNFQAFYGVS